MSIAHEEITTTVSRYLDGRPEEAGDLQPLLHSMNIGADVTSRKEFNGVTVLTTSSGCLIGWQRPSSRQPLRR